MALSAAALAALQAPRTGATASAAAEAASAHAQLEEIRRAHRTDAERVVRSATEELSAYTVLAEERRRRAGGGGGGSVGNAASTAEGGTTVALLAAQHEAKVSSLRLQHQAELERVQRLADDSARDLQLALRAAQQQHEAAAAAAEARRRQELQELQAQAEQQLAHKQELQHESGQAAVAHLADKHAQAIQMLEMRWAGRLEKTQQDHALALERVQAEAQQERLQAEGTLDTDFRRLQAAERSERAAEAKAAADRVHDAEAKSLQLQMRVVELTSRCDVLQAQMQASVDQAGQARDGMEHNVKAMIKTLEEERATRKAVEARLEAALDGAQRREAEAAEKHRHDAQAAAALHRQQVEVLQAQVAKTEAAERDREAAAAQEARRVEADVAAFKERLQAQLSEQLNAINVQHTQEKKQLQAELLAQAREQSEQNVLAVDSAYLTKISTLEKGAQEQILALEKRYQEKAASYEHELHVLRSELKAQQELSEVEQATQAKLLADRHTNALRALEQELKGKLQAAEEEAAAQLRAQEREASLVLEREKLAVSTQCRDYAAQVQERDRAFIEKLQQEIQSTKSAGATAEARALSDLQVAHQVAEELRADFQKELQAQAETHIEQLRAVEHENGCLRRSVEERLQAASAKYNEQLFGIGNENQRLHDSAEHRLQELQKGFEEREASLKRQHSEKEAELQKGTEQAKLEAELSVARAENLNRAVETLTLEVSALQSQRQSHDMTHQQLSAKVAELEAAKAKVIGDRESAIAQVTEKMLLQLQAAEEERSLIMSQLEEARAANQLHSDVAASQAENAEVVRRLKDQLQGSTAHHGALEAAYLVERRGMEADLEKADTLAAQKVLAAEQQHMAERQAQHDEYLRKLAEAEQMAQEKLGKVGEKFTGQMSQLQQVVASLQQRLVDKESQGKRVEQELQRAQKAIAEITLIYQAREKELVGEAHRMQLTQMGMTEGLKQLQLEKQLQHSRDEHQLVALQSQVQQALAGMQAAVASTSPQRAAPAAAAHPFGSPISLAPPSQAARSPLQPSVATPPYAGGVAQAPGAALLQGVRSPTILAQHQFSQQLAKKQAAAAKASSLLQRSTQRTSSLLTPQGGFRGLGPSKSVGGDLVL